MITKQQYIDSIAFELTVIRHLATKVDAAHFEFRPTPKQRSMHELMQYMSTIFGAGMDMIATGDQSKYAVWSEKTPAVTVENFDSLIALEDAHIREVLGSMSDAMLEESITLYGTARSRAEHLINGPLKWAAAYKMQLFMYLKMTGNEHLNTMNLWVGIDPKIEA
jgi:hypothetical protein